MPKDGDATLLHRSFVRGFSHECESDEVPLQEARELLCAAGQLLLPRVAERCSVVRAARRAGKWRRRTRATETEARPSAAEAGRAIDERAASRDMRRVERSGTFCPNWPNNF